MITLLYILAINAFILQIADGYSTYYALTKLDLIKSNPLWNKLFSKCKNDPLKMGVIIVMIKIVLIGIIGFYLYHVDIYSYIMMLFFNILFGYVVWNNVNTIKNKIT